MRDSLSLAVDPSSPDASVEEQFFEQGLYQEAHPTYELPFEDEHSRRARLVRWAGWGSIGTAGLMAIALLIWGGPAAGPIAAAPAPPPTVPSVAPPKASLPPTPAAEILPAPPIAAPDPVAAPVAATPAADFEEACRNAFGRKRYKDVLDYCARAFDAKPEAADLAVKIAEMELDRGRPGEALAWARKAVAADPNAADAYVFIGGAEQQSGHPQAAKIAYLKYLELAPNGRFGRELRAVLRGL